MVRGKELEVEQKEPKNKSILSHQKNDYKKKKDDEEKEEECWETVPQLIAPINNVPTRWNNINYNKNNNNAQWSLRPNYSPTILQEFRDLDNSLRNNTAEQARNFLFDRLKLLCQRHIAGNQIRFIFLNTSQQVKSNK
jgi:hypothetical protein